MNPSKIPSSIIKEFSKLIQILKVPVNWQLRLRQILLTVRFVGDTFSKSSHRIDEFLLLNWGVNSRERIVYSYLLECFISYMTTTQVLGKVKCKTDNSSVMG